MLRKLVVPVILYIPTMRSTTLWSDPPETTAPTHFVLVGITLPITIWFMEALRTTPLITPLPLLMLPITMSIGVRTLYPFLPQVTSVLLGLQNARFLFPVFPCSPATQHRLSITLRVGIATGVLPVGPNTPRDRSTSTRVLRTVLPSNGKRMVTRLLLKLVPNVAYVNGRSRTVPFLTTPGRNVRTFRWRSAGVWPNSIGRFPTMRLKTL